jgi:hypothetical protein
VANWNTYANAYNDEYQEAEDRLDEETIDVIYKEGKYKTPVTKSYPVTFPATPHDYQGPYYNT